MWVALFYLFLLFQASWASYGSIFALVMYMVVYGVGSPIPWMITGELFDQKVGSSRIQREEPISSDPRRSL